MNTRALLVGLLLAVTLAHGASAAPAASPRFPPPTFRPAPGWGRVDRGWEGQPARNVQQRLRWAWVRGWWLDVRVYFGTQQPGRKLLRAAQAELDRLRLPGSR